MTQETSPARAYLDQLASEGAYDSSGAFTVGEKAALEKLGAFQLPRESAWVLKVVQSAVSWGAAVIDVKQGKRYSSFAFTQQHPFDLDAVEEALTSTDYSGPSYVQHLAVGLRAVGFGKWRPFELHVHASGGRSTLCWDGETLSRQVGKVKFDADGSVVELRVKFSAERGSLGFMRSASAVKEAAEESVELSSRAAVCPVALKLDGRRLDLLSPPEPYHKTSGVSQLCLAWSGPSEDDCTRLQLPSGIDLSEPLFSLRNRVVDNRIFFLDGNKTEPCSEFLLRLSYHYDVQWKEQAGAYRLNTRVNQKSWLHGVWDGVVCDSKPLTNSGSSVRADLYFSAQGLPTDISGLALIQDTAELHERRSKASAFACASINRLTEKLVGHHGPYIKLGGLLGTGILLGSFLGGAFFTAVTLMTGIIFSPAVVMGGIEMKRANSLVKLLVRDCQTELQALRKALANSSSN